MGQLYLKFSKLHQTHTKKKSTSHVKPSKPEIIICVIRIKYLDIIIKVTKLNNNLFFISFNIFISLTVLINMDFTFFKKGLFLLLQAHFVNVSY